MTTDTPDKPGTPRAWLSHETPLERGIDEILHYLWDPIGVRAHPQARDEYADYVPRIVAELSFGTDAARIATLLASISADEMQVGSTPDSDLTAARCIVRLHSWFAAGEAKAPTGTRTDLLSTPNLSATSPSHPNS